MLHHQNSWHSSDTSMYQMMLILPFMLNNILLVVLLKRQQQYFLFTTKFLLFDFSLRYLVTFAHNIDVQKICLYKLASIACYIKADYPPIEDQFFVHLSVKHLPGCEVRVGNPAVPQLTLMMEK